MLRKLFKDSIIYGIGGTLSRGISFLLLPLYTRYLTPTDYGTIDMITIFGLLAAIVFTLEQPQAFARFFPEAKTGEEKRAISSTAFISQMTGYSIFVLLGMFFHSQLSGLFLGQGDFFKTYLVSLLWIWVYGALMFFEYCQRFGLNSAIFTMLGLINLLLSILMTVVFIVVFKMGVIGVFLGQLSGRTVAAVVGFFYSRKDLVFKVDPAILKKMLRYSLPLVPSSIAVFVTSYFYRIVLKEYMGLADVGLYGIAQRFAAMVSIVMSAFQMALVPLIYHHYKEEKTPSDLARLFKAFTGFFAFAIAAMSLFSRELLMVFTTPAYYGAAGLIPMVATGTIITNMVMFAPGLGIRNKTGTVAVITTVGAVASVLLNYTLIPLIGFYGAAIALVLGAVITFTLYTWTSQRHYRLPHAWGRIAAGVSLSVMTCIAGTVLQPAVKSAIALKIAMLALLAVALVKLDLVDINMIKKGFSAIAVKFSRAAP